MPDKPVVILHGYSDNSESFEPLATFLTGHGFDVVDIWLADYLTMYDEVTITDLGQAMGQALRDKNIPDTRHSFDLIAHSTGGLVVREYLCQHFYGKPDQCPIEHLLFLAPAHFGSPLAGMGQSVLGRFMRGWKWDGVFQTGTQVLNALKLGSPISWRMAQRDLFDPANSLFRAENLYTTILMGTDKSPNPMRAVIHENGSDGVVRVATSNLNARYLKLRFTDKQTPPQVTEIDPCYDPIAFGVLYGHDHSAITSATSGDYADQGVSSLGYWILRSLSIQTTQEYSEHVQQLKTVTETTFSRGLVAENECYHQYQHVVIRLHDQHGNEIPDYCVEFFREEDDPKKDDVMVAVHKKVLEKVTVYAADSGYRSFFFDITDLHRLVLDAGYQVDMSVSARALSDRISFLDPDTYLTVAGQNPDEQTLLRPNTTLLVDIELPRITDSRVFRLRKQ